MPLARWLTLVSLLIFLAFLPLTARAGSLIPEAHAGLLFAPTTVATPALVGNLYISGINTGTGGAASATQTTTLAMTTGHTLVVFDAGFGNSGASTPQPAMTAPTIASGTLGTCRQLSNAYLFGTTNYAAGTEGWACPIQTGATAAVTAHWASTCYFCNFISMDVRNLSTPNSDAYIGNTASGNSAVPTVLTNGAGASGQQYFYVASFLSAQTVTCPAGWSSLVASATIGWYVCDTVAAAGSAVTAQASQASSGWNAVIGTGSPIAVSAPTITSVKLNNATSAAAAYTSGNASRVGLVKVTMSDSSLFTGTITTNNTSQFSVQGQAFYPGGSAPTCSTPTSENISIIATPGPGEGGSAVTQPITVTCTNASPLISAVMLDSGTTGSFTSGFANAPIGMIRISQNDGGTFSGLPSLSNTGFSVAGSMSTRIVLSTSSSPPTCTIPTPIDVNISASLSGSTWTTVATIMCMPQTTINVVQNESQAGDKSVTSPSGVVTWPLNKSITTGNTVVGFIHASNDADNAVTWPTSVQDDVGNTYTLTPPVQWAPNFENVGLFYKANVSGTPTTLKFDFSTSGQTVSSVDSGFTEYSGANSIQVANPILYHGQNPTISITPTSTARVYAYATPVVALPGHLLTQGYSTYSDGSTFGENFASGTTGMVPANQQQNPIWYSPGYSNTGLCLGSSTDCPTVVTAAVVQTGAPPPQNPFVTAQTLGTSRNNFSGDVGFQLTVGSQDLTATKLGRWIISGNNQSHTMNIYNSGCTSIGSVSVNASGATAGQYLYGTLSSPVTLSAGATYYITSSETSGSDSFYDSDTTITPTSAGSVPNAVFNEGAGCQPFSSANNSYGPVNFQYQVVQPVISGVTPSNGNNFGTPAAAGANIDTLTATCSTGSCAGATFAFGTGGSCTSATANGSFAISGSNLNIGGTTLNAGSYPIGIVVNLTGATNSGACYVAPLVGQLQSISSISPSSCNVTSGTSSTCATMATAMSPVTPLFTTSPAGTYSTVAGGSSTCNTGHTDDTTNFTMSGANLNFGGASLTAGTYYACVQATK